MSKNIKNMISSVNIIKLITYSLLIVIVISIIMLVIKLIKSYKEKKMEKIEVEQIKLMDRMLKPAEISLKVVQTPIQEVVKGFITAVYNNDIKAIPNSLTESLYQKLYAEIKRCNDIGIKRVLLSYEPNKQFRIKQNNSSIYSVTELYVTAKYKLEFYTEHVTFKKRIVKEVEQGMVFISTNNESWKLHQVDEERIINQNETDL